MYVLAGYFELFRWERIFFVALYAYGSKVRVKICLGKLPLFIVSLPSVFVVTLPRPVVSSSHFISCASLCCAIVKKIL